MKANEAPKEIYLLPDDKNPNDLSICWYEAPYRTGAIEYARTDAFIEKVSGWLKDCATFTDMNGKKRIDKEMYKATVEDFENYMKGE